VLTYLCALDPELSHRPAASLQPQAIATAATNVAGPMSRLELTIRTTTQADRNNMIGNEWIAESWTLAAYPAQRCVGKDAACCLLVSVAVGRGALVCSVGRAMPRAPGPTRYGGPGAPGVEALPHSKGLGIRASGLGGPIMAVKFVL
jgi:hypothetical protein